MADDHPVVREGLRRILDRQVGIEVVGEADRGDAVLALVEQTNPDIVILDIEMPGTDFLELIPAITAHPSGPRVLVLSGHPEEAYALHALRAGAAGYLEKANAAERLVEAVRRIHDGGRYISASLAEHLAGQAVDGAQATGHAALSARELEVLRLMGAGVSLKGIAARLKVNAKTISTYRARVLAKLGLKSNADLVRYALEHKLVSGLRGAGRPPPD
jgi:two-component system, NarL family, invasion response regulator UvrY